MSCKVKWFNPLKGFGFLVPDDNGSDILLHQNVLRKAGQSTIAEGIELDVDVVVIEGRRQATAITALYPNPSTTLPRLAQFADLSQEDMEAIPYQPSRVKWFDETKGIGFANVFKSTKDVFIHVEVLHRSGLTSLQPGEAIAVRVMDGDRGLIAVQLTDWA
jgi:CspA family cold shock protein